MTNTYNENSVQTLKFEHDRERWRWLQKGGKQSQLYSVCAYNKCRLKSKTRVTTVFMSMSYRLPTLSTPNNYKCNVESSSLLPVHGKSTIYRNGKKLEKVRHIFCVCLSGRVCIYFSYELALDLALDSDSDYTVQ